MSVIISNFIILIFENIAIIMYILQSKKFLSISYIIYIVHYIYIFFHDSRVF